MLVVSPLRAYCRRLVIWARVARHIKGRSSRDSAILRRAFIKSPLTALKRLHEWRDPTVPEDCTIVTTFGTFHIRADSDDLYLALPTRERVIVRTMRKLLRSGDCFVDAGANIGVYTVLGSRLAGQVIAIEMMPETASILRRHVAENGCTNVKIVEAALSDRSGQTVTASVEPGKYGSASIIIDRKGETVEVTTTTLAEVLADVSSVRLLKMDLEGAELVAIKGLPLNKVEAVLFEDWGDDAVAKFLERRGFRIRRLDGNNSLAVHVPISPCPAVP